MRKKRLWVLVKLIATWFVLLGILGTITGQTNAYFTDSKVVTRMIPIGTWETEEDSNCSKNQPHGDCRNLSFSNEGFDGQSIFVTIKNSGETMLSNGEFEIYFIENGNPKVGERVTETLTFQPIKTGQELKLTYTPNQSGFYMFKSFNEGYSEDDEIWSILIGVPLELKTDSSSKVEEKEESIEIKKQEKNETNNADGNDSVEEKNSKKPEEHEEDESSRSPISENPFANEEKDSVKKDNKP